MGESEKEVRVPSELPILPIKEGVIFPSLVVPLAVTDGNQVALIDEVLTRDRLLGILTQKNTEAEPPSPSDLYPVGIAVSVVKMLRFPDDSVRILIHGMARIRIEKFTLTEPHLRAKVEVLQGKWEKSIELEALTRNVKTAFQKVVELTQYLPDELIALSLNIEDPGRIADFIASNVNFDLAEKQEVLELVDPMLRLERVNTLLNKELNVLELGQKIRSQVKTEMDKAQREYFLREQLKAIQSELGEEDEREVERKELTKKIALAKMPKEVEKVAENELDRLVKIPVAAAEYNVSRTYLDWLVSLPWSKETQDNLDIQAAQRILDDDHYGLEDVKERIIEYLAVRKLKKDTKGPILCFVGPPGVGKTSLGRSIARALGRKFSRFALGGVRDEAEIRGHRRTYIGALPGRVIQGIRRVESKNPVFMLDEVDKIGVDFRGDPASALLEVLDPEQNFSFSDHYLEVPFDLSKVMFITTANIVDTIPSPLLDRMEVIELSGYTEEEKIHIAKRFLVPRQIQENGLTVKRISFEEKALSKIVRDYTREAGVRNLERKIASICRKVARDVADGKKRFVKITPEKVVVFLGPEKFYSEVAERKGEVGIATGLAWTPAGGEILFIEATKMKGTQGLILTGQLGSVMKESAQAALSCIRSDAKEMGVPENFFENSDIHIHVPSGAIPKDGPSAGIAMAVALISLLTGRPVRPRVAMTGEITLTGKVLPIGGVKEKVLAAKRAGIKEVILPDKNEKDLKEVPEKLKKGLQFHFVNRLDDVVKVALQDHKKH
ncbi:endopeptidase La [candidate division TA06 bacterium]|nr:endopeptidase La [candidate division TA06 bacterium]